MNPNVLGGIAVAAIAGIGILIGASILTAPVINVTQNADDTTGGIQIPYATGQNGADGADGINFGAVSALNSPLEIAGVSNTFFGSGMTQGTTTPWSYKTTATTSIDKVFCGWSTGTTTAMAAVLTKSAQNGGQQATTTALGSQFSFAANAQGEIVSSTTPETTYIVGPNTWIQLSFIGGAGTVSPVGKCVFEGTRIY